MQVLWAIQQEQKKRSQAMKEQGEALRKEDGNGIENGRNSRVEIVRDEEQRNEKEREESVFMEMKWIRKVDGWWGG